MAQPSAEKIAQRAFDLGLLDEQQLREIWAALGARDVPVNELLQLLLRREYLTNYQVERLVKGERSGFFFGPYKVLYLVGSGTFARVYRGVHKENGQVVALKVLRNRFSDNPEQYERFLREGQLGRELRHPNIVPIYDVCSDGRTHYLVMEFVEGWNLRDFVKIRTRLDAAEATRLMIGITDGLRYAFERGLTHRDLKLSNVLISSRGQPKLVDFGLAALDDTVTDEALADLPNARTIDYAALERVTGVRKDDTRSDIYFLGCIYYHMLSGQAPLPEGRDRVQRLSKWRFQRIRPIRQLAPEVPDAVALVVNKAMMLDPNKRYQTPAEMLADLHIAARRLAEVRDKAAAQRTGQGSDGRGGLPHKPPRAVMIVESNAELQDTLRTGLKRAGYRVLLTIDPVRALRRFQQDGQTADCVVFDGQTLGRPALEAFNDLAETSRTHNVRAMLLLDRGQSQWQSEARTAPHRQVVLLPITMKEFRARLASLLDTETGQ